MGVSLVLEPPGSITSWTQSALAGLLQEMLTWQLPGTRRVFQVAASGCQSFAEAVQPIPGTGQCPPPVAAKEVAPVGGPGAQGLGQRAWRL